MPYPGEDGLHSEYDPAPGHETDGGARTKVASQTYPIHPLFELEDGAVETRDIVKLTVFLTDSRFIPAFREVRGKYVGQEPYPASTLLVVAGLADPSMLVEVEVVAAK